MAEDMEIAVNMMASGFRQFCEGLVEMSKILSTKLAAAFREIDWDYLARIKEQDPDLFNWNASGPIRRVQLRRARAMMGPKGGDNFPGRRR